MPTKRVFFLGMFFFLKIACAFSISCNDSTTVTLNFQDVFIKTVLNDIERQTGTYFTYTKRALNDSDRVSVHLNNVSVEKALWDILKDKKVVWAYVDSCIVIRRPGELKYEKDADTLTISGWVGTDEGTPLQGATVQVKGLKKGTVTDKDGTFVLWKIPAGSTITFSCIGFNSLKCRIASSQNVFIQMSNATNALNETVVVGYWKTTKKETTSTVDGITAGEIKTSPVSNALTALVGRVPGVQIIQESGIAGGQITLTVRGRNSILQGNEPLYIIDGIPFLNLVAGASASITSIIAGFNPLNNINAADIESISILKDADATAIYGSRGANGVVLINTKKAKPDSTRIHFDYKQGIGTVQRMMKLLNRPQYLEMRYEALRNDNASLLSAVDLTAWDTLRDTDWQKELIGGTAKYIDAHAGVSGGNATLQFLGGTGLHKESSVFPADATDIRLSMHFSLNAASRDQRFKLVVSGMYVKDDNRLFQQDPTGTALRMVPVAPAIFKEDGSLNWAGNTWDNPYAIFLKRYSQRSNNLIGSCQMEYNFLKDFYAKINLGGASIDISEVSISPLASIRPDSMPKSTSTQFNKGFNKIWIVEPQLEYKHAVWHGLLTALAGASFQQNKNVGEATIASGYTNDDDLLNIEAATALTPMGGMDNEYRYLGFFGRVVYELDKKYRVNFTGRKDGSSRLRPGKEFAGFGAIGAAWSFGDEKFFKRIPWLSFGQLRVSYGTAGNDQIKDYGYLQLWVPTRSTYGESTGISMEEISNPNQGWEVNRKLELAMDIGLLEYKLNLSASYYRHRSGNQLVRSFLPGMTGFNSMLVNQPAVVQNKGWEFEVKYMSEQKNGFRWSVSMNITLPVNKLLQYPGIEFSALSQLYQVGQPLTMARVVPFYGVNTETGMYEFKLADGSITTEPVSMADATVIVALTPDYYGGINSNVIFKGLEVDVCFQFTRQLGLNYLGALFGAPGMMSNQPAYVMGRWQQPGDISNIQRFTQDNKGIAYRAYQNSYLYGSNRYTDASFFRLKNISISYRVPHYLSRKILANNLQVYLQGQNVWTVTGYHGLDPETRNFVRLPPLRVITAGIHITI